MDKKIISLAIGAAIFGSAVNAAQVYSDSETELNIHGRAQGAYYFSSDKNIDGDQSYIRVGLDGKSQINDDLYAFGLYELQFKSNSDANNDDEFDVRKGYVGVGSEFWAVSYGRQFGAVTLVSDYTDIFPEFGNEAAGVSADVFGTGRSDSVFKATGSYDALNVHVSYQGENDQVSTDASSYGIAADYALPFGVKVALGYNEGEGAAAGADSELVTAAVSYTYEDLYAAVLFSDGENWEKDGTDNGVDYEGIEAVVTYQVTEELNALIGYNNLEKDGVETVDYYSLGGEYNLTPNFKTLAEYKITDVDGEDDVLALALRYSF
ncbi:porin [Vibrio fortis]|jgi:outer membrane porin protein LC|uniref:Porin n=1 Tax=Vibrio fortis TaxID=212667 RepID=A0A5N3S113_9VIBR|nr:porin [Vibrio fortis]KAB0300496.1 porin [Vibrio fortis]